MLCIKEKSPPASITFIGQATEHTAKNGLLPKYTNVNFGFLPRILSNLDAKRQPFSFLFLKLTVRVKRALSNVQAAKNMAGRQKRDVREVRKIEELENRAAELMKKLDAKEG